MWKKTLIIGSILTLALATAYAQGRGGGGMNRGSGRGGVGSGRGQGQMQGPGENRGMGEAKRSPRAAEAQAEHKRVKSTSRQRKQIRDCDQAAENVGKQARKMAQNTGNRYNAQEAARQHKALGEQVRKMDQQHERLIGGLNDGQKEAWRDQIRNMTEMRRQLHNHIAAMQAEQRVDPDGAWNAERAREIERIMNRWRTDYGTLAAQAEE